VIPRRIPRRLLAGPRRRHAAWQLTSDFHPLDSGHW